MHTGTLLAGNSLQTLVLLWGKDSFEFGKQAVHPLNSFLTVGYLIARTCMTKMNTVDSVA